MNTEPLTTWDMVYAVAFGFVCGLLLLFAAIGLLYALLLTVASIIESWREWRLRVRIRRTHARIDRERAAKSEPQRAPR